MLFGVLVSSAALAVLPGGLALPQSAEGSLARHSHYEVFEKLVQAPAGWVELPDAVDGSRELTLKLHLAQQNVDAFHEKLMHISSPRHASYGAHMSKQQVQMMLAPAHETVDMVGAWLEANGLGERAAVDSDWVVIRMTVAEAEDLLEADYRYYQNTDDGRIVLRTLTVSIPRELRGQITLIQPTTMFGLRNMKSTIHVMDAVADSVIANKAATAGADNAEVPASCNTTITPSCLAALYNTTDYTPAGLGSIFVSGFLEQYAQFADLQSFEEKYAPSKAGANFTFLTANGGGSTQFGASGSASNVSEANLDIQYTVPAVDPIPVSFVSVGGRPPFIPDVDTPENTNEPYLDFLNYLLNLTDEELPKVVTTSYGEAEQTIPLSYRLDTCNLFGQLGARGVSIIFSSGDEGPGSSCITNDGTNTTRFLPTYPACCPWVTAVGATFNVNPEAAVSFSSGGFSDTFARPSYQDDAVNAYFDDHPDTWEQFTPYFNQTGRAIPDVSASGLRYRVILIGQDYSIGGTSASAPTVASIVALVNDHRLQNGKSVLGFLNPLLYENPQAFTDIVDGTSSGCSGSEAGSARVDNAGWKAVEGWDASTGLGTPIFTELIKL